MALPIYDALDDKANNKGYHVHCDVDNTLELKIGTAPFFLDLGNVHIKHIGIPVDAEYSIRGYAGTVIDNMNDVRDAVTDWDGENAEKGLVKITLHGNNTGVNKTTEDTKKIYGIEGVPVQLPECDTYASSPVFTRVCGAFKYWNTVDAGTGTNYANNEFYIPAVPATTAVNLYAQWGAPRDLKPVGGRIYLVGERSDAVNISGNAEGEVLYKDVIYRFFNADGTPINLNGKKYVKTTSAPKNITDESLLAAIGSKAYYAVSATPSNKYFHVYDTTNKLVGGPGSGMSYGGHNTNIADLKGDDDAYIYMNETRARNVWAEDGSIKAGHEVLFLNRNSGTVDVGDGKTYWSYIDYINDYGNDRFYGDGAKHGWGEKKPGGCSDWVLPWGKDLVALAAWSNALTGGGSSWLVKFDTAATPPSDPDRAEVFEWFKTKNIALGGMGNASWFYLWGYEYDAGGSYAGAGQFKRNAASFNGVALGGKCYDYCYCLAVRNF